MFSLPEVKAGGLPQDLGKAIIKCSRLPADFLHVNYEERDVIMTAQIKHMVIFNLVYGKDSPEAEKFLTDGQALLTSIPAVKEFEVLRQVSTKNDYDFGFSMVFDNEGDYVAYNNHPIHQSFVAERWKKEVSRFLEIDFIAF